jgi:hypothetical protein
MMSDLMISSRAEWKTAFPGKLLQIIALGMAGIRQLACLVGRLKYSSLRGKHSQNTVNTQGAKTVETSVPIDENPVSRQKNTFVKEGGPEPSPPQSRDWNNACHDRQ